ncbi:MAG TPA: phospholipase [Caulobacteraceae bacterium]
MIRLDGPRVPPTSGGKAKQLVILAHGYGSNGDDLIGLAPYFARLLPDAVFVSPNAPDPVPGYPGGYQWFPISGTDPRLMAQGAQAAAGSLERFIDQELQRYVLPASACALVGFSQGTMMSLHVGLRRPEPLAAILGYSGMLPVAEPSEVRSRPPVALVHGDRDDVIPVQALFASQEGLAACGVPALWRISGGAGHTIAEGGLALGAAFLRDAFRGRFAGWTPPERRPVGAAPS